MNINVVTETYCELTGPRSLLPESQEEDEQMRLEVQDDALRGFKLRLNFTFCSQASIAFYRHCKILKIIIYTPYICFNAGKIEQLNLITFVCRYSAIATWGLWNCNPRPVSFYVRNLRRLSNPKSVHYKLKSHNKQMTSNAIFPRFVTHCVWQDIFIIGNAGDRTRP